MGRFVTLQWLTVIPGCFLWSKKQVFCVNKTYVYLPVVTRADRIAAGDQSGRFFLRSATIPDTTGVDIDVPDMKSYPPPVGTAASIPEPGAAISGCT